jgi:hypothetical protein
MKLTLIVISCCTMLCGYAQPFRPDLHLKRDRYTNLLIFDGVRSEGIQPMFDSAPFMHLKFWAENWNKNTQWVSWDVIADKKEKYLVNVICNPNLSEVICTVSTGDQTISKRIVRMDSSEFVRVELDSSLWLQPGVNKLILMFAPVKANDEFNISVHAIELIRPEIREKYNQLVTEIRSKSDTRWFRNCRYGIFVTWTSQVYPRNGERKDYETAVSEFDVDGFVKQIVRTRAGLVVFNTSHAEMYFPAPIKSLDSILPGRTTRRDLISDLGKALAVHGIRLFLYYHLGCVSDPEWTKRSGFWNTDERPFFAHWNAVITEIGRRYGKTVSGYWFDDGAMNCYYRSPDWLTMYRSAKAGNPERLIGYNPWKLPPPTLFMDYYLGETNLDPSMHGELGKGGNGFIQKGPFTGLQASSTFVTESEDWGHFKKDTEIESFRYTPQNLAEMLLQFEAYRNVPLMNLEIYQDGLMSERSIRIFEEADKINHPAHINKMAN